MTLTIETTPELEEKLRADAERHGVDAASYVLQLLEQRYVRSQAPLPDLPTVGSRWRSASGLDADAIEDRRQSEAPSRSSFQRRSSRRGAHRQHRKTLTTQVVSIVVVLVLLAGLIYALFAYKSLQHVAAESPVVTRPTAVSTPRKAPDAVKPQADAVKPQADHR